MTVIYDIDTRIANCLLERIRVLDSDGADWGDTQIRKFAFDDNTVYPGVSISPVEERYGRGTNETDDVCFPFLVTLIRGSDGISSQVDTIKQFRTLLRATFHNKVLREVSEVYVVKVRFADVFLPRQFRVQYDATAVLIEPWAELYRV